MSHEATNWAFEQTHLKPGEWRVLANLANCHNPANGCFPTQSYLAGVCNLARSTVNEHLNKLEKIGLIRRHQQVCEQSGKQRPTRYILGFEKGFEPVDFDENPCPKSGHGNEGEPCPENGQSRVRKTSDPVSDCSDSNEPVKEPVKEPVNLREARERADDSDEQEVKKQFDRFWRKLSEGIRLGSSRPKSLEAFSALSEEDRALCADRMVPVFEKMMSLGRSKQKAVQTVIREEAWRDIEVETENPPGVGSSGLVELKHLSKPWHCWRMKLIAAGPDGAFDPSPQMVKMMESMSPERVTSIRQSYHWRGLAAFDSESREGFQKIMKRAEDVGDFESFVHVMVGSEAWQAWLAWFDVKDAPPPDMGSFDHAFFPSEFPPAIVAD